MNIRLEKHQEWLKEIETKEHLMKMGIFSNTFLISVAIDHKKRETIIVVLRNIFSATNAKEHLRKMGINVTSVKKLEKIDAQDQWFS